MYRLCAWSGGNGDAENEFSNAFPEGLADSKDVEVAERARRARKAARACGSWERDPCNNGLGRAVLPATGFQDKPAEGVAMKRYALIVGAVLGLLGSSNMASASWGSMNYSGYQPWYNIFAKRNKCL